MSLTGKSALTTAAAIANDGFWPQLLIGDLMDKYRIPSEYADKVIKTGLVLAMVRVNDKLKPVKTTIKALGHNTLAAYIAANPGNQIDGIDVLLTEYENAVFARAKAGLLMQFASVNRKPQAENLAKESDEMETYWLDQSQSSIAELLKRFLPAESVRSKANTKVALL